MCVYAKYTTHTVVHAVVLMIKVIQPHTVAYFPLTKCVSVCCGTAGSTFPQSTLYLMCISLFRPTCLQL